MKILLLCILRAIKSCLVFSALKSTTDQTGHQSTLRMKLPGLQQVMTVMGICHKHAINLQQCLPVQILPGLRLYIRFSHKLCSVRNLPYFSDNLAHTFVLNSYASRKVALDTRQLLHILQQRMTKNMHATVDYNLKGNFEWRISLL